MQYFKPGQEKKFVGDCMPFFHDGVFHLYYLLDENHHAATPCGGHQWAHASSRDLVSWTQHPLAIPITDDWEGSICTGSVFSHDGAYYGFYATRKRDYTQHLGVAVSNDGIQFAKRQPNPLASAPAGYHPNDFRDPCVFRDPATGRFHMVLTATREAFPISGRGGCLLRLVSDDLRQWALCEPFLEPGLAGPPECPDFFFWNGWYYLIFSNGAVARYRMARTPFGPWLRPPLDTFEGEAARVMKTAAFTGNRRIGVAWVGTRKDDKDDGFLQWGGHALFRELIQDADGTLAVKFVPEMMPRADAPLPLAVAQATPGASCAADTVRLADDGGLSAVRLSGLSADIRLRADVTVTRPGGTFGLRLRQGAAFDTGYELALNPFERRFMLHRSSYPLPVAGESFSLELIVRGTLIDVCLAGRACIVERCPEPAGNGLSFYALDTGVIFSGIEICPLSAGR